MAPKPTSLLWLPWLLPLAALAETIEKAVSAQHTGFDADLVGANQLPLRTSGRRVVDRNGRRVRLASVNWYGAHLEQRVVSGLDAQPVDAIAARIASLGFNSVRLPFSLDLVFNRSTPLPRWKETLQANPGLSDLSPLEVFDATVNALTHAGLMVILNIHVSRAKWCCDINDGEGLWYTQEYPEEQWLEGLTAMTRRYLRNGLVVGFDLRNELRADVSAEALRLAVPTWGEGGPWTADWGHAAIRAARRVLAVDPDMLIFVSGVQFGMRLTDIPALPIHVSETLLRNRTVYTAHTYKFWSFNAKLHENLTILQPTVLAVASMFMLLLVIDIALCRSYHLPAAGPRARRGEAPWGGDADEEISPDCYENMTDVDSENAQRGSSRSAYARGSLLRRAASCAACGAGCGLVVLATFCTLLLLLVLLVGFYRARHCSVFYFASPVYFEEAVKHLTKATVFAWMPPLLLYALALLLDLRRPPAMKAGDLATALGGGGGGNPDVPLVAFGDIERTAGDDAALSAAVGVAPSWARARLGSQLRPLRTRRALTMAAVVSTVSAWEIARQVSNSYGAHAGEWDGCWGFLLEDGGGSSARSEETAAPVWLNEFGTSAESAWWRHLMRYLWEHDVDFGYWSVNGERRSGHDEPYGLLMNDWKTVRHPWKLAALQYLISQRRAAGSG